MRISKPKTLVVLVITATFGALGGCVRWTHISPSDLELHGKVGLAASVVSTPVAVCTDVVSLPVMVFLPVEQRGSSHLNPVGGMVESIVYHISKPGFVVETAFYHVGAGIAYPLHLLLEEAPRKARLAFVGEDERVRRIIMLLPTVSDKEYNDLVMMSGRSFYPPDKPYAELDNAPYVFGVKSMINDSGVREEWLAWLEAGRPTEPVEELAFVLGRESYSRGTYWWDTYFGPDARIEPRFLDELVRALGYAGSGVRMEILIALVRVDRDHAVLALTTSLNDKEWSTRRTAAELCARMKDPRMVDPLLLALKDPEPRVRSEVIGALSKTHDPELVDHLVPLLSDPDAFVAGTALRAISHTADPRVVELAAPLLQVAEPAKRRMAISVLSEQKGEEAATLVLAGLKDQDVQVRSAAAYGLRHFGDDPRIIDSLTEALNDRNASVRKQAIDTLAQLKDPHLAVHLLPLLSDSDRDVADSASYKFYELKDPKVVELIGPLFQHDDRQVRLRIAVILGYQKGPKAAGLLISGLKDPDAGVRAFAAQVLRQFANEPGVVDSLKEALSDLDADVRENAAESLRRSGIQ